MHVETIRDFQAFLSIREEWNSLLAQSMSGCVSLTHEWLSSWWKAFGDDTELFVVLVREDDQLIGAAPLFLKRDRFRGLPASILSSMVNGHSPEGGLLASKPDAGEALLEYLGQEKNTWDVLFLKKLPCDSWMTECLPEWMDKEGFSRITQTSAASPCIDMTGDWQEYYSGRSKKFRKVMRNKLNRIDRDGSIMTERISDLETLQSSLNDIFDVSSKSWKAQDGRSIPDDPRVIEFYENITALFGALGMVELWLIRHEGRVIAFEYHLRHNNFTHPIRADYDEEYRHLSPGSVLEYRIIKVLFEDPDVREYNSCGDTYDYLMKWATRVQEYVSFQVFNSRAYSRNLFLLESKMVPVARKAGNLLKPKKVGIDT